MSKCDCYHIQTKRRYTYNPITGDPIGHNAEAGVCWGTKECEECSCGGDAAKCDFYPEVRERALKKVEPRFGEWISVKDRLPKCYGKYLVACNNIDIPQIRYYDGEWDTWNSVAKVTHWMSLPTLPKGE